MDDFSPQEGIDILEWPITSLGKKEKLCQF